MQLLVQPLTQIAIVQLEAFGQVSAQLATTFKTKIHALLVQQVNIVGQIHPPTMVLSEIALLIWVIFAEVGLSLQGLLLMVLHSFKLALYYSRLTTVQSVEAITLTWQQDWVKLLLAQ